MALASTPQAGDTVSSPLVAEGGSVLAESPARVVDYVTGDGAVRFRAELTFSVPVALPATVELQEVRGGDGAEGEGRLDEPRERKKIEIAVTILPSP